MEMFLNCSTSPHILISLFINSTVWWEIRLGSVIVFILQTNQIAPGSPYQEDLCPTEPESVGKNGHRCRKEQKGSITSLISSLPDAVFP